MHVASSRPQDLYDVFCRFHDSVGVLPIYFLVAHHDMSLYRIWDVENKRKQKMVIVVKSKERGARTKVTACGYSTDGNLIGGGMYMLFSMVV